MSIIKSLSVGNGDMYYIKHNSDNFTIIDCHLSDENYVEIIKELRSECEGKGICRFISTHPDEDHIGGIDWLDDAMPIVNFYVVKNNATKPDVTDSFERYCALRDGKHAFYISQGSSRKWLNEEGEGRGSSGIQILWPELVNPDFQSALHDAEDGIAFNNMSLIARYSLQEGASFMWLGDLETDFMDAITDHVNLVKTDFVFAAHHGRISGKIPNSWLDKLEPKIIVLGEAPSRDLHYYSGYHTITQNKCGDVTFDCVSGRVHIYVSSSNYTGPSCLVDESKSQFPNYIGTLVL